MANKISWKTFFAGVVTTVVVMAPLIVAIDVVKNWSSPTKPQILATKDCDVTISSETVWIELFITNPDSKDCSVISVEPPKVAGVEVDLECETFLVTIPSGQTKRIVLVGYLKDKLELQPDQDTVEGTVIIKFNTNDVIQTAMTLTIFR